MKDVMSLTTCYLPIFVSCLLMKIKSGEKCDSDNHA